MEKDITKELVQLSKVTKMANIYKNIHYQCRYMVIYAYKTYIANANIWLFIITIICKRWK